MSKGYITLSRKIFDSELWKTNEPKSLFEAWIDLIQSARFEKGNTIVKGKFIMVNRGEVVASLRFLAERWNWDKNKVSRILSNWERVGQLKRRTEMGETVVVLIKYDEYNPIKKQKSGQRRDSDGTATGQRRDSDGTNNNKGKNGNTLNNDNDDDAPEDIPAPYISALGHAPIVEQAQKYIKVQKESMDIIQMNVLKTKNEELFIKLLWAFCLEQKGKGVEFKEYSDFKTHVWNWFNHTSFNVERKLQFLKVA